jgi:hypothetical protein
LEQLALLLFLVDDPDPVVARTAAATIDLLPGPAVASFLARRDVPQAMRDFFAARGIATEDASPAPDAEDAPLFEAPAAEESEERAEEQAGEQAGEDAETGATPKILSALPVIDRMKLAMRGSREQRGQLIRDANKLVAAAVLSSPKLTEAEVEAFARMANLSEDVIRIIAVNRGWVKNYNIVSALTRNPKTPPALAMGFLQRLNERDLKRLAIDRNVAEPVRLAARKFVVKGQR